MGCGTSMEPPPLRPPGPIVRGIMERIVDPSKYEEFRGIDFGFENLVLEGGGTKALAYCGMLKALEDLGIMKKLKRFAGASMGAAILGKLAIGADAEDLFESFTIDLKDLIQDSAAAARVPNLFKKKGMNSGDKMMKHFTNICVYHTGVPDKTFKQLYDEKGIELCMIVSNLDRADPEYYHVKTTPNETIPATIRKSLSIPLLLKPCTNEYGDILVDGGLMNNYPVNAFDGWYLSMSPEHSFLEMTTSDEEEFGTFNGKTLGALVFDATETEIDESLFLRRTGFARPQRPNTNLARSKAEIVDWLVDQKYETGKVEEACKVFLRQMNECDHDRSGSITVEELRDAVEKTPGDVVQTLFGDAPDIDKLFNEIDTDGSGEITYDEFMHDKRLRLSELKKPKTTRKKMSLIEYVMSIIDAQSLYLKKTLAKSRDHERTIGIYTDYINTTDWDLETADKEFLAKQGWEATIDFLRERKRTMIDEGKLDTNQNSVTT